MTVPTTPSFQDWLQLPGYTQADFGNYVANKGPIANSTFTNNALLTQGKVPIAQQQALYNQWLGNQNQLLQQQDDSDPALVNPTGPYLSWMRQHANDQGSFLGI